MSTRPAPVRRLERAALAAVAAASARDAEGLEGASVALAALEPEMVRSVLGHALVGALQATHPGGLDGDDVAEVLTATVERSSPWWPTDPAAVLAVLLGALGAHDEEADPLEPREVAVHAALVVAEVLAPRPLRPGVDAGPIVPATAERGADPAPRADGAGGAVAGAVVPRFEVHLHAALDELERSQRVEMP